MLVALLAVAGLLTGVGAAYVLARGMLATAALSLGGVGVWLALYVYIENAECAPNSECNKGLAWFIALFVLAGWLVGVLIGRALRART